MSKFFRPEPLVYKRTSEGSEATNSRSRFYENNHFKSLSNGNSIREFEERKSTLNYSSSNNLSVSHRNLDIPNGSESVERSLKLEKKYSPLSYNRHTFTPQGVAATEEGTSSSNIPSVDGSSLGSSSGPISGLLNAGLGVASAIDRNNIANTYRVIGSGTKQIRTSADDQAQAQIDANKTAARNNIVYNSISAVGSLFDTGAKAAEALL